MKRIAAMVALLMLLALAAAILRPAAGTAQQGVSIGVDADPSGNTATSLGPIDPCVRVERGDTFQIDLFVTGVDDLLAWEVYVSFDGDVVNVTDRNIQMFQAANPGSNVWDASDVLPSKGGLYRLGAIDIAQPPAPDSGSGVLARLTLKAVGGGLSPAALTILDANSDGKIDLGPQLTGTGVKPIDDANGDGFFDGPLFNAQIAVGRDCPGEPTGPPTATVTQPALSPTEGTTTAATITPMTTPTATAETASPTVTASPTAPTPRASPTPPIPTVAANDNDGDSDWTGVRFIIACATGGAVAVLAGAVAFVSLRRRGAG